MIPLTGFAPDIEPATQGILTDCQNLLPEVDRFIAAPTRIDAGLGALAGVALGFAVTRTNDNTIRTFSGTATKLYEVSGTWADKSKGGGYSIGPDDRWRFAQFGNVTLAAAKSSTIQAITSGSFADVSGTAPTAALIETLNNQVFVANINGMGFGDDPARWACCAVGNETDWTPDIDTGCVSNRLLDAPGPITGLRRLGDIIVMYKDRAMFVGEYVGSPAWWNVRLIPGNIGAPCQEAIVPTGTAHYFVGPDDFYVFDGSRPIPLESPVRKWFFSQLDQKFAYKIIGAFDRKSQRVFWWFPSKAGAGAIDKCLVLNIKTRQWGRMDGVVEAAAEYLASGVTWDGLGTLYATWDDLPTDISYDSPFWNASDSVLAVFGSDHKAYALTGTADAASFTTWHMGDMNLFSTLSRVRPRYLKTPASASMLYSHSNTDANSFTQNLASTYQNQWFDVLWSAQWHKVQITSTGEMEISGIDIKLTQDGEQ